MFGAAIRSEKPYLVDWKTCDFYDMCLNHVCQKQVSNGSAILNERIRGTGQCIVLEMARRGRGGEQEAAAALWTFSPLM